MPEPNTQQPSNIAVNSVTLGDIKSIVVNA